MPRLSNFTFTALLLLLVLTAQVAWAQEREPSREPILRIETGMHTAVITRIGVDRAGKFLVTASDDKTARVWELQSGRLLRVLRVPIGEGNEGKLYAAVISPDGNTIAAGGWTGIWGGQQTCVYLFDRESGRLVRRLIGLQEVVLHLAFSPDGVLLAATLGGTNGARMAHLGLDGGRARHCLRRLKPRRGLQQRGALGDELPGRKFAPLRPDDAAAGKAGGAGRQAA